MVRGLFDDTLLTTKQIADMMQVDPKSVINWIERGHLAGSKTPGGHRRVVVAELIRFIRAQGLPMPKALERVARPRALIVDDRPRVLERLASALSRRGRFEVHTADNGVDALVAVGTLKPALIVLDIVMPGLDGYEVCRRLRSNPETASVKIVAITGDLGVAEADVLAAGADALMFKPLDASELVAQYDALLATEA